MGQLSSHAHKLQENVTSRVGPLAQLCDAAVCSYDDFVMQIMELNILANNVGSQSGKHLTIGVKRGTADALVVWRATVRIAFVQWDSTTNTVISNRLLTLPQFLRVSSNIRDQLLAACPDQQPSSTSNTSELTRRELTLSRLFEEVDSVTCKNDPLTECCICLERKPDVMLPCAHAYCLPCIEQWNTNHKTCPICRETLQTTDDAWVLSNPPETDDVRQAISTSLMQLTNHPRT